MKDKKYICIKDLQGGNFSVGNINTIEDWKNTALNWCECDGSIELYRDLKQQSKKDIISFISEIWELQFEEITEKEITFISNLKETQQELEQELEKKFDFETLEYNGNTQYLKGRLNGIQNAIDLFYDNLIKEE